MRKTVVRKDIRVFFIGIPVSPVQLPASLSQPFTYDYIKDHLLFNINLYYRFMEELLTELLLLQPTEHSLLPESQILFSSATEYKRFPDAETPIQQTAGDASTAFNSMLFKLHHEIADLLCRFCTFV